MIRGKRIIAIHPNTNGFGFVIISEKGDVLDYGITNIRPVNNDKCIEKINEIVEYYRPALLILEDYKLSNKSKRIKELIRGIGYNVYSDIEIFKYTREQVKNTFEIFGAKNKFEIAQKIVEAYPQFKSKLPHKRKPWQPESYYQGLFDALTLVLTHQYLSD